MWGRSPLKKKQRISNEDHDHEHPLQTDDDSELPSSSPASSPELDPLVPPSSTSPMEAPQQHRSKRSRDVRVGSEVWTGLLSEDQDDQIDGDDHDTNDASVNDASADRPSSEDDPWRHYVSSKNFDLGSYVSPPYEDAVESPWNYNDEIEPAVGVLPEDTFAFLATCEVRSNAFLLAICTMATQLIVLCLLTVDSISFAEQDDDLPRNPLSVPPTSVLQVSISQFLALIITSVSQTDCLQSLMLLHYGYPEQRIRDVLATENKFTYPSLMHVRWYVSIFARFIVGFFTGIVTFLLVVRSETVRDVMLDFTAVEFVSMLDDTAYLLGTVGFFGRHVKVETENPIYDRDALVRHPKNLKRSSSFRRKKLYKLLFTCMTRTSLLWINMVLLSYIVAGQYNGRYLPDTLLIQMGHESSSLLSTHSGLYDLTVPGLGTFIYKERGGSGFFAWCEGERAWTLLEEPHTKRDCNSAWIVKSTELEQFAGMLAVAEEKWYVTETNNIELEADYMRVVSMLGVTTECDNQVYGWTCSFVDPCEIISVDALAGPFEYQRQLVWPTEFSLFRPNEGVRVYEHPVYYSRESPEFSAYLILFTGRQWAMINTDVWTPDEVILSDDELVDVLNGFRVYSFVGNLGGNLGISFLSDFIEIGTQNDRGTPIGLRWFEAETTSGAVVGIPRINSRVVVSNQFICSVCNDSDRKCFYDAPCVNGTCVCDGDNLGSVCELVPAGDAFCNPTFNRPIFNFDGGDCCPLTCVDTRDQRCLKSRNGLVDFGVALCRNRQGLFRRRLSLEEPDYIAALPDTGSVAGEIAMTEDGRSYAVSYRVRDETIMGTRVGSTWTHLGRTHKFGGYRNEIVTRFPNAISSPRRSLPIRGLAASFSSRSLTPFYCNVLGCSSHNIDNAASVENSVVPNEFVMQDYWDPFTLSPDGAVLARGTAVTTDRGLAYFVDLYVYDVAQGWLSTGQRVDLSINRTEVVQEQVPCFDITGASLRDLLENTNINLLDILDANNLTVSDFLAAFNISDDVAVNATNATLSDAERLSLAPLENISLEAFLQVVNFDSNQYGIVFCGELVTREVTHTTEVPLYLSLSDLRSDRTRRLSVGSINFQNRSAAELRGPLTTRVFEISASGEIASDGPAVEILDRSDMNGKSANPSFGIPKKSVSLSRDGNHLVVGSLYQKTATLEGIVKIFEWVGAQWRIRQEISFRDNATSLELVKEGWTNVLSEDGSVLAVTFPRKCSIFRWNGTEYVLSSQQFPFRAGTDVSLSRTGGSVAFAVPIQGGFGSYVFSNDEAPWCKQGTEKLLRVSYTPTAPSAFAWRVVSAGNAIVADGSWPRTTTRDPLKIHLQARGDNQRRRLLLEEEAVYDENDPTDLTFAYDHCVDASICAQVYRDDDIGNSNLGVFFGRENVSSTPPANITSGTCVFKMEVY